MIERYSRPEISAVWTDEKKFRTWLQVEIYVCEAHARAGRIPENALKKIQERADFDIKRIEEIEAVTHHDVIAFLTAVNEKVGPEGRFIHMGLTSSDILDTSNAILMKTAGEMLVRDIQELMDVIKEQAFRYRNTPMMGRSHGVHAEPISFGLKMALWYAEMDRNLARMKQAVEQISYGKISGAVGTFANIDPGIETYVCEKCGLKPAPISTQVIQRDRYAEYMCTIAITGASLEKFALEIRHLARTEVGEVEEFFAKGQKGSSAMPHKRNPIISERICGMARLLRANAMVALENVALWHERDISHSSVERVILPDSTIVLDYMLYKMTGLLRDLQVYPENMMKNLDLLKGLTYSQQILLMLVSRGVTREEAYRIVQNVAFKSREQNMPFRETVEKDTELKTILSSGDIDLVFNLDNQLKHTGYIFSRVFGDE